MVSTFRNVVLLLLQASLFLYREGSGFSNHFTTSPRKTPNHNRRQEAKRQAGAPSVITTTRLHLGGTPNEDIATSGTTETINDNNQKEEKSNNNIEQIGNKKKIVGKVLEQTMVLDGAEWVSVRKRLLLEHASPNVTTSTAASSSLPPFARTLVGVWTVITGSWKGQRVVAMKVLAENNLDVSITTLDQPNIPVYTESIAIIPDGVSEETALATMSSSLSYIHCVLPIVTNVGGSSNTVQIRDQGKIVILGGNEVAITVANILNKLQYQVVLVTDKKPAGLSARVQHLTPAVSIRKNEDGKTDDDDDEEEEEVGFAVAIGSFDSLLDTLGNEHDESIRQSGVPTLLAERHGCQSYISCQTESQQLIIRHGLLWGPGKTKEHAAQLQKRASKATAAQFPSPIRFGETVQRLLEQGITFPKPKEMNNNNIYVRGWAMKDFWEYTTWPRDVTGIRYGLPSIENLASWTDSEDEEDENAPMISAPPLRQGAYQAPEPEILEEEVQASSPHVLLVDSVYALQEKIVNSETTCLLFLSAPFCRTCRYLKPLYQRMARETSEKMAADGKTMNFVFARAEATGQMSKNLGKALGVDSVPSFLLFKNGQKFGKTLSVSRIPSAKLDQAVQLLQDDLPWNEALFDKDEEPARPRKKLL